MLCFSHSVLALAADSSVSRASLKFWLLTNLSTIHNKNRKKAGIMVFIFIPVEIANEMGGNRINKILKEAEAKNSHWISDIQIMATDHPVNEDMLKMFVEQFSEEAMKQLDEWESGEVYFGYANDEKVEEAPVCAVRKIDEASDIDLMREESGLDYQMGDWYIIGEKDRALIISEPFMHLDHAMEEGKSRFGAIRFETVSAENNHG